ncbi:MAG: hypothetical protein ACREC8_01910 [Limisphaerales bacterium]
MTAFASGEQKSRKMVISDFSRWPNQQTLPFLNLDNNFLAASRQAQFWLVNSMENESHSEIFDELPVP